MYLPYEMTRVLAEERHRTESRRAREAACASRLRALRRARRRKRRAERRMLRAARREIAELHKALDLEP